MKKLWKFLLFVLIGVIYFILMNLEFVYVMYIMEGFLLVKWVVFWFIVFILFFIFGLICICKLIVLDKNNKLLLVLCVVFIFVFLVFKILFVIGFCFYLIGVGFVIVMFGLFVVSVFGVIVLFF